MKFPVWATIFTILGIGLLCGLGVWQVQRLEWKTGLLEKIASEYARDASVRDLAVLLVHPVNLDYSRGYIEGTYISGKEILLSPRTYEGRPGYHVITPFRLESEQGAQVILVNRGWVPLEKPLHAAPEGRGRLIGMLRKPDGENFFVPANDPKKDLWYRLDMEQISEERRFVLPVPYVFYIENESFDSVAEEKDYPVLEAARIALRNNHKQYAFFWFSMAAVLFTVYVLRFKGCMPRF